MGEDDRTPPVRRTTVAEAAEALGISAEAVRGRIRRGTLPVEREGGTVYVPLEGTVRDSPDADRPRTTDDRTADRTADRTDLLIAELRDRVRSLEEANRENRRIIAALTSRIPAIEAPREAADAAETVEEAPEGAEPRSEAGGTREQLVAERALRGMAEATLQEGMAEERRRREDAERERDDLRRELIARRGREEVHEAAEERQGRGQPRSAAGGAREGTRPRPRWRRIFGG